MGKEVRIEYQIGPDQWKGRGFCSPDYIDMMVRLSEQRPRADCLGPHRAVEVATGKILQEWIGLAADS